MQQLLGFFGGDLLAINLADRGIAQKLCHERDLLEGVIGSEQCSAPIARSAQSSNGTESYSSRRNIDVAADLFRRIPEENPYGLRPTKRTLSEHARENVLLMNAGKSRPLKGILPRPL